MQRLSSWLDDNLLSVLASVLLVFIPLYPKLPLFDILPGYIVRIRLEDFLVGFSVLIWLIYFIRGKIKLKENPLFKPIVLYLVIALLSMFSAVFITRSVPLQTIHIQKMILHFLRRVEYFSLFFIFFSSVRNLKTVRFYVILLFITIIAVSLYGFGQKYLYWPAFSTMNREFAKGWMLYLTSHARVLSTFGGHYDLAAFIMMALIILWSIFFSLRKIYLKIITLTVLALAFWTLILTASRTSFLAYLFGLTFMFFFWAYKKGIRWVIPRWFTVVVLSITLMLSFGDLSERFTKLLKIDQRIANVKSLLLSPIGVPPKDKALFLENNPEAALSQITSRSDQPPILSRPSDVFQDIPLLVPQEGTVSAVARTYSKTAFTYDLSTAIRFDALWPMAIAGFKKNILLGSGYSTLNKIQQTQFTEAESTDNDYLRSLGETGILGFLTFYGTLGIIVYYIWKNLTVVDDIFYFSLTVGLVGVLFGLLMNAVYIDVFESSKVAFSFWGLSGIVLASLKIVKDKHKEAAKLPVIPDLQDAELRLKERILSLFKTDGFYLFLILLLAFYLRLYKIDTPLADWHSWRQADTSAVTRNYVKHGINILYPTYDDLSNVASGKDNPRGLRFVEFPLYNVASVVVDKLVVGYNLEVKGRLTSVFASLFALVFLFLFVRKYSDKRIAFLTAFFFAILPFNIFFNRTILPESFLLFTTMGMIYYFDRFVEKLSNFAKKEKKLNFILNIIWNLLISLIFTATSLLIKPFAVFLFPVLIYLWIKNRGWSIKSLLSLILYLTVAALPFFWWRWWMSHFPEGIPANTWLLNGDGIRFKGAFFYWIFADRLVRLILGYWGISFLVLGLLSKIKKEGWLYTCWGIGLLFYLFTFATGNVRHDYYQIILIPLVTIFMAKGSLFLFSLTGETSNRGVSWMLLIVIIIFTEMFAWYHVRDYYNINHPEIVEAGNAVERLTSNKTLVIAPYNGDTAFLYQTRRSGWPIMQDNIEEMIKKGATHYVSVEMDDLTKQLIEESIDSPPEKRKYKLLEITPKYTIIQLVER